MSTGVTGVFNAQNIVLVISCESSTNLLKQLDPLKASALAAIEGDILKRCLLSSIGLLDARAFKLMSMDLSKLMFKYVII
jgi:hypothetical protein